MSAKRKPGRPRGHRWTDKTEKFCEGREKGMNQTDAARYAKYERPDKEGVRLMQNSLVLKRLAQHKKMRKKATQNALNEQALEAVINRREVEQGLAEILKTGASESARVSAAIAIARINGWLVNSNVPDPLKGKSADELEFIAIHGRDPHNAQELLAFTESRRKATGGRGSEAPYTTPTTPL